MKLGVVSDRPWRAAKDYNQRGERGAFPGRRVTQRGPGEKEREKNAESGIGEEREAPECSVGEPVSDFLRFSEREGSPKDCGGEEYGERSVPNPFEGHHDAVGIQGPEPAGECDRGDSADAARGEKERNGGGGRKNTIQKSSGEEGGVGERSEQAKNFR